MTSARAIFVCLLAAAASASAASSDFADSLFKAGGKAERAGDILHAYFLYARASDADPQNVDYLAKKTSLRAIAAMSARTRLDEPMESGPAPGEAPVDPATLSPLLPPPELAPSAARQSFDIKGDARMIYERVASAYGIAAVFDADYQTPPPFTFRMTGATFVEAMHALDDVTSSFVIAVGPRVMMVVRDNPQKRNEREPVAYIAIPLPEHVPAADAKEILQVVQSTLEIRRAQLDFGNRLLILRDKASHLMAARALIDSLSRPRAQIEVDVQFVETSKTSSLSYGINLPNEISLVNFSNFLNNSVRFPSGFSSFLKFGGGATTFALGVTNASAFATLANATADNLLEAKVVAADGQPASLLVGNRFPIVTNSYIGNTSLSNSGTQSPGQVFTPPPTINYEDLGLTLKITPSVHAGNEVTLDIDAEFKVLGATSPTASIPVIANRKFVGKVRLQENEWAVVAGLISTTESETRSGYPGLLHVPFLGRIFGTTSTQKDSTDVLLVLKPHLISLPPWDSPTQAFWIGSDTRPLTIF